MNVVQHSMSFNCEMVDMCFVVAVPTPFLVQQVLCCLFLDCRCGICFALLDLSMYIIVYSIFFFAMLVTNMWLMPWTFV